MAAATRGRALITGLDDPLPGTRRRRRLDEHHVQLIRVGAYQGAPITEALRYRVKFKFLVNPDLTRNGRFPTAVAAFQVEPINKK